MRTVHYCYKSEVLLTINNDWSNDRWVLIQSKYICKPIHGQWPKS